jgi:hypothetical protein
MGRTVAHPLHVLDNALVHPDRALPYAALLYSSSETPCPESKASGQRLLFYLPNSLAIRELRAAVELPIAPTSQDHLRIASRTRWSAEFDGAGGGFLFVPSSGSGSYRRRLRLAMSAESPITRREGRVSEFLKIVQGLALGTFLHFTVLETLNGAMDARD